MSKEIISKRYLTSLSNLKLAVKVSDRAFFFDNSGKVTKMILEVENGINVTVIELNESLPNWINTYLVDAP